MERRCGWCLSMRTRSPRPTDGLLFPPRVPASTTSWCKRYVTPIDANPAILEPDALVDTSLAVALVVADHEHHRVAVDATGGRTLGLAGHAAFETFSPDDFPAPPFPRRRFLNEQTAADLLARLGTLGSAGGASA